MNNLRFLIGVKLKCEIEGWGSFKYLKRGQFYTGFDTNAFEFGALILQDESGETHGYFSWADLEKFFDMSKFEKLKVFI